MVGSNELSIWSIAPRSGSPTMSDTSDQFGRVLIGFRLFELLHGRYDPGGQTGLHRIPSSVFALQRGERRLVPIGREPVVRPFRPDGAGRRTDTRLRPGMGRRRQPKQGRPTWRRRFRSASQAPARPDHRAPSARGRGKVTGSVLRTVDRRHSRSRRPSAPGSTERVAPGGRRGRVPARWNTTVSVLRSRP